MPLDVLSSHILWSRSHLGFWMIPFSPQRGCPLPHSLLKTFYVSFLVLYSSASSAFHSPARWATSSTSLFRHSPCLHIHVYVGFSDASTILSLPAIFSCKWQSLDSNRKEKVLFRHWGNHVASASRALLFHSVDLWKWIWWNRISESFTWIVYIFWTCPSQPTVSQGRFKFFILTSRGS